MRNVYATKIVYIKIPGLVREIPVIINIGPGEFRSANFVLEKVLKYTGRQFFTDELTERIMKCI